jgi:predicted Holliday junction resolvase-like endonuclease
MFDNILDWWILIMTIVNVVVIGGFSLLRTYYQRKALKVQEETLRESREYWNSWQKRSKNIKIEMKDEMKKEEKVEKESKRIDKRTRSDRRKAQRDKAGKDQT